MKKLLLVALVAGVAVFAPGAQSLEEIVAIGEAHECSVSDLVAMAPAIVGAFPDAAGLSERLDRALARYDPGLALTKGRASLVVAKGLGLRTSLLYLALPIERYAFRALVLDGVFDPSSGGGDVMSGVDLMEFVTAVGAAYRTAP